MPEWMLFSAMDEVESMTKEKPLATSKVEKYRYDREDGITDFAYQRLKGSIVYAEK